MEILKLSSLESHNQIPLNEENLTMLFHRLSLESKSERLKRFLKPDQSIEKLTLPFPIHAFVERV